MLKVGRFPANDRAEAHNRGVTPALGQLFGKQWNLKTAGNERGIHAISLDAVALKTGQGAAEKTLCDQLIEARDDYRKPSTRLMKLALKTRHR